MVHFMEMMKEQRYYQFPPLYCSRNPSQCYCVDIQLTSENMAFELEVTAPSGVLQTMFSRTNVSMEINIVPHSVRQIHGFVCDSK